MTQNPFTPKYTLETNADGTTVVKLVDPVLFRGEEHSRLTIPRITGRHLRKAAWGLSEQLTMGHVVSLAADIIEPVGIVDELPAHIARDLSHEVMIILGKSEKTGRQP